MLLVQDGHLAGGHNDMKLIQILTRMMEMSVSVAVTANGAELKKGLFLGTCLLAGAWASLPYVLQAWAHSLGDGCFRISAIKRLALILRHALAGAGWNCRQPCHVALLAGLALPKIIGCVPAPLLTSP